jgi:DNA (cytosine-5)-methyltransferase 1
VTAGTSRPPFIRALYALPSELVVDNFAGGGGASTGIEEALGRPVDIAINHSPEAIEIHRANHRETKHFCENILEIDPAVACGSRPVGLAWFSPDCVHFSRAKGQQPLRKEIRGLAWVVIRWAKAVRPRTIVLENVEEFQTWGPLDDQGRPLKSGLGQTFREWLSALTDLGYAVEFRSLVAADYGTPTTRRRLFLIARCDGQPIVWPETTHGKHRTHSWRPAAEVIDWSLPVPSIFDRKKPLAEATQRRIALGIQRYVLGAARPFIVPLTHHGAAPAHSIADPVRTVTAAHRGELALGEPFVVRHGHYSTVTGAGLRAGCGAGTFRGQSLSKPLATVCGTNDKHLVCPLITKHYGGVVGHEIERPLGTVTGRDHHALSAAFLTKFYGTSVGSRAELPMPTITASGKGGGHLAQVRAFMIKYSGSDRRDSSQQVLAPLQTLTPQAHFGFVMIHGEPYQIVDIGMRMLQPRELFNAQGFPADYVIDPLFSGRPMTKTAQIAAAGNSVCPQVAAAIVSANVRELARRSA